MDPAAALSFRDPDGHLLEYLTMLDEEPKPKLGIVSWSEWLAQRESGMRGGFRRPAWRSRRRRPSRHRVRTERRSHVFLAVEGGEASIDPPFAFCVRHEPALGYSGRHDGGQDDDGDEERELRLVDDAGVQSIER